MKFISAETMRNAERLAIEKFGIPGLTLMETAGRNCSDIILSEFGWKEFTRAAVIAGKGNNGGDGYVIARYLCRQGWRVRVFVMARADEIGGDAAVNLALLNREMVTFCAEPGELGRYADELDKADLIVDALFGIGLKSDLGGVHAEAVELINSSGKPVVAVDIPSGVDSTTGAILGAAVRADLTVTFAFAKTGHVLYPGAEYTGLLKVAGIGLPPEVTESVECYEFVDAGAVSPLLRKRNRCAHKGDYGHCLILAGSTGKTGAAALAANSAVRTGSGLVTLAVPASLNPILEIKTTEAMTMPLEDSGKGYFCGEIPDAVINAAAGKDAVALGPGIGRNAETAALIRALVEGISLPMVIDADGLNAVSEDVSVLRRKKSDCIVLTPHPGEMSRLSGLSIAEIEADRIASARDFAAQFGVYIVLKGARTVIAAPDRRIAVNGSGNPGMASGGMGDVLTGVLVSLLGQRYPAFDACRIGAFLHGYAADLVAQEKGEAGISAMDVQERLPWALKNLIVV
jgi:NAD(P)H-hydrate epimerase